MMNFELAKSILENLVNYGVKDICICAGARNAPFIYLLENDKQFNQYYFFEERSAAFFALGKSQKTQKPVAVFTTSGTAVAETLPAVIESFYSSIPLIIVSADRPKAFRNTGSPQTINQIGIFSTYVEKEFDLDKNNFTLELLDWFQKKPIQINVCFEEPMNVVPSAEINLDMHISKGFKKAINKLKEPNKVSNIKTKIRDPIVVVGGLNQNQSEPVLNFLIKAGLPVYLETLSNLRFEKKIEKKILQSGDKVVTQLLKENSIQSIIRIGGIPTSRVWRDLEEKFNTISVFNFSDNKLPGLSRSSECNLQIEELNNFYDCFEIEKSYNESQIFSLDLKIAENIKFLLSTSPYSEIGLIDKLYQDLENKNVYIGNSLPIREFDLLSFRSVKTNDCFGNRGANGIDGQISTFLGWASKEQENWCFVGDLTALYDLSSLWASKYLQEYKLRIVVINNRGGQIFKNIFNNKNFINEHSYQFEHWAKMWNWEYQIIKEIPQIFSFEKNHAIIELMPSQAESEIFWTKYKQL